MIKKTTAAGGVMFQCTCEKVVLGGPDDTLMAEGSYEQRENDQKHAIFIERAPFDLAANTMKMICLQCKLDFVTMIRVGVNETTMYSCICGWQATHDEYMRMIAKPAAAKSPATLPATKK